MEENAAKKLKMDAEMRSFIKAELEKVASKDQLVSIAESIKENSNRIKGIESRMETQSTEVASVRNSVQRLEIQATEDRRGLDRKIRAVVNEAMEGASGRPTTTSLDDRKFQEYDRARRALRIWPIHGNSDLELRSGVEDFVMNALLVESFCQEWVESIEKVHSHARGAAHDEVVVYFVDKSKRDEIFSARPKLSAYIAPDGKPTSGMRLQIPSHLLPAFKLLESYGYELRKLHGETFRRYIKFEEFERTLYLQVKFPNIDEWFNISVEEARLSKTRKDKRRIASAREYLSPEGRLAQPRSLSLGDNDTASEVISSASSDDIGAPLRRGRATGVPLPRMDVDQRRQTWKPRSTK